MEKNTKVIEKIIKLMEKAESAKELGSIAEAETFAAKAQELLATYNLSKSDLTKEEAAAEIIHMSMPAKVKGIGGKSSFNIMQVIAKFNWCSAYTMGKTSDNKMIMVGSPENIEACQYIHSIVMRAFMAVGKVDYKKYKEDFEPYMNPVTGKPVGFDTYMRTFFLGASQGLHSKLREEREAFMEANASSTAIVRTNEVVVVEYVNKTFGGTGRARRTSYNGTTDAFDSGKKAGKNVSITKGVKGTSTPITRKMIN